MEQKDAAFRGVEIRADGGNPITIVATQNVRPGIVIAIADGRVLYDGPAATAPVEVMNTPGLLALMHPHLKAQLDAATKKANRKFKPL